MDAFSAAREADGARSEFLLGAGEFTFFRRYIQERSGLSLGDEKGYLVAARLAPVARRWFCRTPAELIARLGEEEAALSADVVEAMATHETLFFRDGAPFDAFRDLMLPGLLAANPPGRAIRIWSAACSTGQEPYSLAMLLEECGDALEGRRVEILATDLSTAAVALAREGRFSQFEAQRGLSIHRLLRHFEQEGASWRISPRLKERVTFRTANLTQAFAGLGSFHVVFCRNALLYFDEATRADVALRLASQVVEGGYLAIGATETFAAPRPAGLSALPATPGVFVKQRPAATAGLRR